MYDLALTAVSAAGAVYSAGTLVVPNTYLEMDGAEKTDTTRALTRGIGAGIAGLTALSIHGRMSENNDVKKAALCSLTTGFVAYSANNFNRVFRTRKDSTAAKTDLVVGAGLGALCTAALMKNKKPKA